ncbi:hypothetical protein [Bacillus sp. AG4(2022)]|uniref:hypothetical protein n=1 Tax=Bacillus sp. AG4(2022) TaxID=2962594 RepID=UPI002881C9CC|nr:hypothetical protein [Bacillus sp. AG4(2022)]MDT0160406.1 hypothetical protein [Bacillus sp. AG4(2022)]
MYVIKDMESGKYAKHTGETVNNEGLYYVEYPWELVDEATEAQKYKTLEHANEVAFWELDSHIKWTLVNLDTKEEFDKQLGKYFPI